MRSPFRRRFEVKERSLSEKQIITDMQRRNPKFDLREDYWRQHPEEFWENFETTDDIRVPEKFRDWIVGQDEALEKIRLNLHEWIHTLKDIQKYEDQPDATQKISRVLRERPTTNILMLGEPGTGKSLIAKIMGEELKELYDRNGIKLYDVLLVENQSDKYSPLLRYVPAGTGRKVVEHARRLETVKEKKKATYITLGLGSLMAIGALLMALGFRSLILNLIAGFDFDSVVRSVATVYFVAGASLITFPLFIWFWFFFFGSGRMMVGGGRPEDLMRVPNLLVDNNPEDLKYYVEATRTSAAQLFGSIEWDAFGRAGAAPYLRVRAGLVHKANKLILYIDEMRNLSPSEAIGLLTAMEDGEIPVRAHGDWSTTTGAATAELNVDTPPIRCLFFLLAAGNMDVLYDEKSVLNQFPALRDRFENYGDIIYLKHEFPDTPLNRMKVAQVVADEIYRFNFPPMTREGVLEIINYMRRRATNNSYLRITFRSVIKIIKRSAQLAWDRNMSVLSADLVREAVEMMQDVETQVVEHALEKTRPFKILETSGYRAGVVNGLSVLGTGHGGAGDVVVVTAWVSRVQDPNRAGFEASGIVRRDGFDIEDCMRDVRTVIYRMYGIDLAKDYYTHIKFSQSRVDGPSAGITAVLAIMSLLGDPRKPPHDRRPVGLRQDVAVTGALEIYPDVTGDVRVSAVGGIHEKVRAARRYGIKYVIIPE
ncbi:MAG: S16 family serine protease, partial [Candidatus Bathyarchaeia archaeon]